jgi:protein arginine N-methyltransferase 1
MLTDLVRVEAFDKAIFQVAKDKVVMDVGTGQGILAIKSAEAGASKVYAIELTEQAL